MLASVALALVGLGLVAAPGALGYDGLPRVLHLALGPALASIGIISAWEVMRPLRRIAYPIGVAVALAPLAGDQPAAAVLTGLAGGAAAALLALVPARIQTRFGGGWTSLVDTSRLPRSDDGPPGVRANGERSGAD